MKNTKRLLTVLFAILLIAGLLGATAFAVETGSQDVQGIVQSEDGTLIAGAEVALIDMDAREIVATMESDAYGAFNFAGKPVGEYMVAVVADGFTPVTVPVTEAFLYVELASVPMARGFAPTSATGMLMVFVMDSDWTVLENATVTFNGAPVPWNGFLWQTNVVPGQAGTLQVSAPGFHPSVTQITAADFFGSFAMVEVFLQPGFDVTASVVCAWLGTPIAGAEISLMPFGPPAGRDPIAGGPTDSNGTYTFYTVPAGMWMVSVAAPGFSAGSGGPVIVPPTGSGLITVPPIELVPIITAQVLDARFDTPIAGAEVVLWRSPHESFAPPFTPVAAGVTDANGLFHFEGQAQGSFFIAAEADHFISNTSLPQWLNCSGTLTVRLEQLFGIPFFTAIEAGSGHTVALRNDGTVWTWGRNQSGQLGDGTTANRLIPVQVLGGATGNLFLRNVIAIAAGDGHTVALRYDGTVWAWGANESGQLGDGTTTDRLTPVQVAGLSNVTAIAAGGSHTVAIQGEDSVVWAWGSNQSGQLGDGTTIDRHTPVQVLEVYGGIAAIAAGDAHTIAFEKLGYGQFWAWGSNQKGQLDGNPGPDRPTPSPVIDAAAVIAAGGSHTTIFAIEIGGGPFAWGNNSSGQLGDGTTTDGNTMVHLPGDVTALTAGDSHTVALLENGTVWAWGNNGSGRLGDGTTTNRLTPVPIFGNVIAIAAGGSHTVALLEDGTIWTWGNNQWGQLGDGTTTNQHTPILAVQ